MWQSIVAMLTLAGADAAQEQPVLPDWMTGCWEQSEGDRWTEECWMKPRGGVMLGMGRSGRGEKLGEWEVMRIVRDLPGGDGPAIRMALIAAPGGKDPTVFGWSPDKAAGVAFVNAAHDYPQRIRYWREGELLMAEISLADGGKPRRWRYRRVRS